MALTFMAIVVKAAMSNRSADDVPGNRFVASARACALVMANGLRPGLGCAHTTRTWPDSAWPHYLPQVSAAPKSFWSCLAQTVVRERCSGALLPQLWSLV